MGKWGEINQICVKIIIYKGCNDGEVIYYRNKLPMLIVEQWRWYFDYLAALVKGSQGLRALVVEAPHLVNELGEHRSVVVELHVEPAQLVVVAPQAAEKDGVLARLLGGTGEGLALAGGALCHGVVLSQVRGRNRSHMHCSPFFLAAHGRAVNGREAAARVAPLRQPCV